MDKKLLYGVAIFSTLFLLSNQAQSAEDDAAIVPTTTPTTTSSPVSPLSGGQEKNSIIGVQGEAEWKDGCGQGKVRLGLAFDIPSPSEIAKDCSKKLC